MKNKFIIEWTGGSVLPTQGNKEAIEFLAFLKDSGANVTICELVIDGKTTNVLTAEPAHAR